MGDAEITSSFSKELQQKLDDFQASIKKMLTSYEDSMNFYSQSMQKMLSKVPVYAAYSSLIDMHQNAKKDAFEQLKNQSKVIISHKFCFIC